MSKKDYECLICGAVRESKSDIEFHIKSAHDGGYRRLIP